MRTSDCRKGQVLGSVPMGMDASEMTVAGGELDLYLAIQLRPLGDVLHMLMMWGDLLPEGCGLACETETLRPEAFAG